MAEEARKESEGKVEEAQKIYQDAVDAITPLREAKAAYNTALSEEAKAKENYEKAVEDEAKAVQAVVDAKAALEQAEAKKAEADKLSLTEAMKTPIEGANFSYLNAYVDEIKLAEKQVEEIEAVYEEKKAVLAEAKKTYDQAKLAYAEAVVDLADAQESYDQFMKTSTEQNGENVQQTEKVQKEEKTDTEERITVKTGDSAEPALYATAGMGALAAALAAWKKKHS